jgi:hypothetical protein
MVFAAVPTMVKTLLARPDSSFYCWDAVQAYESVQCGFIIVARKTARLVEELKVAEWQGSSRTDADGQSEFWSMVAREILRNHFRPQHGEAELRSNQEHKSWVTGPKGTFVRMTGVAILAATIATPGRSPYFGECRRGTQKQCRL